MINKLTFIMLAIISLLMAWSAYWVFYPFKVVEVDQPYVLHETEIRAGDILQYTFEYCRYTDADVDVQHQLVGTINIRITGESTIDLVGGGLRLHKGCGTITKGVFIPSNIPVGTYHLEEHLRYYIHPLRTILLNFRTESFRIVDS